MSNPDDANKSTVIIRKKSGELVKQTTYKGSSGTTTTRNGKTVYRRDAGSDVATRPDKVQLARPEKEIIAEQISSQLYSESLTNKPSMSATDQFLRSANAIPKGLPGLMRPDDIVRGASVKKEELSQQDFNKRFMGLSNQEGNTIYSRDGSFVAVKSQKDNTLFFTKAYVQEPERRAETGTQSEVINVRSAVQPGGRDTAASGYWQLKDVGMANIENMQLGSNIAGSNVPGQNLGVNMGAGVIKEYWMDPIAAGSKDILIVSGSYGIMKGFGFVRGLMVTTKVAKPISLMSKGVVKGVTAGSLGVAGYSIATSDKPQETAGVIAKDFALFGIGSKIGFDAGLKSAVKFKANKALKAQKTGLITTNNPLSKDIRVLARVQEVKSLTLVETSRAGTQTQRSFVELGKSNWVNVKSIPKTDFVRIRATGQRIVTTNDYGISQVYKPIIKTNDFTLLKPTRAGLIKKPETFTFFRSRVTNLDNKAFARIVGQSQGGMGRITSIKPTSTSSQTVINMRVEGMKFSGERGVYNPFAPLKPAKIPKGRWLARSKPIKTDVGTVQGAKPGSATFTDYKVKDLDFDYIAGFKKAKYLGRVAKPVKVFKADAFKAEPTKDLSQKINIIKDEGTGLATIQILKTEMVTKPVTQSVVTIQKTVPKSIYEANPLYDLTRNQQQQPAFAKPRMAEAEQQFAKATLADGKTKTAEAVLGSLTKQKVFMKEAVWGGRQATATQTLGASKFRTAYLSQIQLGKYKTATAQAMAVAVWGGRQATATRGAMAVAVLGGKTATLTKTAMDTRSATSSLSKTQQTQYKTFSEITETMRRTPAKRTPQIKIPGFDLNLQSSNNAGGLFIFEVGKQGNKIRKVVRGSNFADTVLRSSKLVRGTAAASFKSLRPLSSGQKMQITNLLGSDFRRAKRDPSRFVQRRSKRISSAGELKDITFKGLGALRFQKMRGGLKL